MISVIPSEIQKKTFTGQTYSNGEFELGNEIDNTAMIVCIQCSDQYYIAIPYKAGSKWNCTIRSIVNLTPYANQASVTVTVWYKLE